MNYFVDYFLLENHPKNVTHFVRNPKIFSFSVTKEERNQKSFTFEKLNVSKTASLIIRTVGNGFLN